MRAPVLILIALLTGTPIPDVTLSISTGSGI
jgi:hypothetical protein